MPITTNIIDICGTDLGSLFVDVSTNQTAYGTKTWSGLQSQSLPTGGGSGGNTQYGFNALPQGINNVNNAYNTAFGDSSLYNTNTGKNNTAMGYHALYNCVSGNNTAVGSNAGLGTSTNNINNTAVGANALKLNTGSNNTAVGYGADVSSSYTNSTAIGANALCTGSNQVVLGTTAETVYVKGSLQAANLQASGSVYIWGSKPTGYNSFPNTNGLMIGWNDPSLNSIGETSFYNNGQSGNGGFYFWNTHSVDPVLRKIAWIDVNGNFNATGALYAGTTCSIWGTNTSTSTSTGALTVAGGVGIGENLNIGGKVIGPYINLNDTTSLVPTISSKGASLQLSGLTNAYINITKSDNRTQTACSLQIAAWNGIGFGTNCTAYPNYYCDPSNQNYAVWIDTRNGGMSVASGLWVGTGANIAGTTASTSTSTGALVVGGGVGIAGNLYVGGTINGNATNLSAGGLSPGWVNPVSVDNSNNRMTFNIPSPGTCFFIMISAAEAGIVNARQCGFVLANNYSAQNTTSFVALSANTPYITSIVASGNTIVVTEPYGYRGTNWRMYYSSLWNANF